MSYFDTPIGRCEVKHTMVLIDQTQEECEQDHGCPPGCNCPLASCLEKCPSVFLPVTH